MTVTLRFAFALEYVADIAAAKRFYVDVLGLEVEREAPVFIQFKDQAGARFAIASDAPLGDGRGPELYWAVDDAEAAFEALAPRTRCTSPSRTGPSARSSASPIRPVSPTTWSSSPPTARASAAEHRCKIRFRNGHGARESRDKTGTPPAAVVQPSRSDWGEGCYGRWNAAPSM